MTTDAPPVQKDMQGNTVKGNLLDNNFQLTTISFRFLFKIGHMSKHWKQPSFYVFPTRCATGYHGNPQTPGGRCEECKCSLWGAWPEPCDPVTGQCHCRVGATGQSCDQCTERHVCGPTGIICKTNTAFGCFFVILVSSWTCNKTKVAGFFSLFLFLFFLALITVFANCLNTVD